MGRKSNIQQYNMLDGQTVNMSSSIASNITNVEHLDKASIHLTWTAGPAGEFKVLARNGGKPTAQNLSGSQPKIDDTFYELDFGSAITITGADGQVQIVFNELPFTDIKVTYTASSGAAADLKMLLTAKGTAN